MEPLIIDRGRGPEIKGTRITVYTIMDYLEMGWHRDLIAAELRLSSPQVQAAINYIDDHKSEVGIKYQHILNRAEKAKNPPEVEAIRVKGRAKIQALLNQGPTIMNQDNLDRITLDPDIMAGRATIRNTRVTVSNLLAMLADGISEDEILTEYPYLENTDLRQALAYAAWRTRESGVPLKSA